jgi:polyisoprenyl-phosphate glycosyltransferase
VGRSSYTFRKLAKLAGDTILAHSQTPLKMTATLGLSMAFLAFLLALVLILRKVIWGISVVGWTSLIVSVFVVGGMQIFVTGIVGIYVGKCFEEAKRRPLYFVKDTLNIREAHLPVLEDRRTEIGA